MRVLIAAFKSMVVLVEQTVGGCVYCFYPTKIILFGEIYLVYSVLGLFTFSLQKVLGKVSRGPRENFKLQRQNYCCSRLCNPTASSDAGLEIDHPTGC